MDAATPRSTPKGDRSVVVYSLYLMTISPLAMCATEGMIIIIFFLNYFNNSLYRSTPLRIFFSLLSFRATFAQKEDETRAYRGAP